MTGFLNFDPIQAGDTVTVIFDGTTADLVGTFQRFITDAGTAVVTTPAGEDDPALQTTHYIDDFQYIAAGAAPAQINDTININVGDNITVYFGIVPQANITGTITGINPANALIELDVGGTITVVKDYWYLEKN